ncbi:YqaJ viral recombinase family protein [Shewanella submarina]|uniref:Lambda exonuclease family protein n=1 Tax=Shewanella submarina TaxID=2016376 RepID=A0ABV7G8J0_9GAMM|nr:lambda exonuclease family protein [Shewanella submarina]MCL1038364.1 YqaJ viral recombinase family protein [Shewanella submarina]
MIIHEHLEQGTQEWLEVRLGKITGSMVANIMANGRGGKPSAQTKSYMMQLMAEKLTGIPTDFFQSKDMQWGTDHEDEAREIYEFNEGFNVKQVGFVELSEFVGYSPDGLVEDDGMIEIKCPKTTTQLVRFFDSVGLPAEYKAQVQFGLLVTGRSWCDFVSYDPRLEGKARYLVTRVYRDEEYLEEMVTRINNFIEEFRRLFQLAT